MTLRIKLELAYHGRSFHGWQRQRGQRTVQGELERALSALFRGSKVSVTGAGRTDAGVHAAGQVAHFDPPGPIPTEALVRGLNARLPREIRVRAAGSVPPSFHARRSALGKLYTYRGRWGGQLLPWHEPLAATVNKITDPSAFSAALEAFEGRHDWASFTVPDPGPGSTIRTLSRVRHRARRQGFDLEFIGEGFLRYQIRRMVGALLEVGTGQRPVDEVRQLLETPQPGSPIRTAPPEGLCLEHVYYRACPAIT